MTAFATYRDGVRRVSRAPALLVGLLLFTWLFVLPLAVAVRSAVTTHLGPSLVAERVSEAADLDWWEEYSSQATGLGQTLTPSVIGFAAVLTNLSDLADDTPMGAAVAGVVAAWLVVWSFLAGGILDRYARDRAVGARGFFAAAGLHAGRLIRLGLITLLVYGALFKYVHGWLFEDLYGWLTRDLSVERTAMAIWMTLAAVFGLLLVTVNIIVDYARIRLVIEDRRSAMVALAAAFRFVRRRATRVAGLYGLNVAGYLGLVALYAFVAPGADVSSPAVWIGLVIGQLYVLGRLCVKLQFYASQTAFFQAELAHAGYVAGPLPTNTMSPVEEAIRTT